MLNGKPQIISDDYSFHTHNPLFPIIGGVAGTALLGSLGGSWGAASGTFGGAALGYHLALKLDEANLAKHREKYEDIARDRLASEDLRNEWKSELNTLYQKLKRENKVSTFEIAGVVLSEKLTPEGIAAMKEYKAAWRIKADEQLQKLQDDKKLKEVDDLVEKLKWRDELLAKRGILPLQEVSKNRTSAEQKDSKVVALDSNAAAPTIRRRA